MKTVSIEIKGTSPLLINRFKENDEQPDSMRKGKKDYGTSREQAEATAYRDESDQRLWIPSIWITGAIRSIASDYKLPGTRKSVKSVSGGAVLATGEKIYFKEGFKLENIEVDSRPVVIQRARIMRHRAKLESWTLSFDLEIDETILEPKNVHDILGDAGKRAGLGDYRPQRGGPFGRFQIVSWVVQ